ncbi:hypothetical protein [Paraburkholderia sp. BCC1886]|uniref:hypothetical protein n=1 Tax=Paraburkholderia sp. BCC1886 TaxID=2562670 RepID=UPI0011832D42|nr:hypothetical protein [Paraburkholderia sp. BCC1886]
MQNKPIKLSSLSDLAQVKDSFPKAKPVTRNRHLAEHPVDPNFDPELNPHQRKQAKRIRFDEQMTDHEHRAASDSSLQQSHKQTNSSLSGAHVNRK